MEQGKHTTCGLIAIGWVDRGLWLKQDMVLPSSSQHRVPIRYIPLTVAKAGTQFILVEVVTRFHDGWVSTSQGFGCECGLSSRL